MQNEVVGASPILGDRLRGRAATQRSKKGSSAKVKRGRREGDGKKITTISDNFLTRQDNFRHFFEMSVSSFT